jgi:ABC-type amino acid transport substrate-binding protein
MLIRACLFIMIASVVCSTSAEPQPIRFITAEVWPWGYIDAGGQPAGLLPHLARRLSEASAHPLQNRVVPHQRLLQEFRSQKADFTVLFENPALDDVAFSIGEVLRADVLLITPPDSALPMELKSLGGRRVGYIRGTYYGEEFAANTEIIKIPIHSMVQAIDMLQLGRLDAMVGSDMVFFYTLRALRLETSGFRFAAHLTSQPAHLYMARQAMHPEQAAILRSALDELRRNGELARLFEKPEGDRTGLGPEPLLLD